jgi:hypothetical protein
VMFERTRQTAKGVSIVSRTFFQPDVRTPGASMKGGRYAD